jgi:hypothetical protein
MKAEVLEESWLLTSILSNFPCISYTNLFNCLKTKNYDRLLDYTYAVIGVRFKVIHILNNMRLTTHIACMISNGNCVQLLAGRY